MTRRTFAKLSAIATVAPLIAPGSLAAQDAGLQSEFLLDLVIETVPPNTVGGQLIVPVTGGTFDGPRFKGTIVAPGGDWIVQRADGTAVLDARLVLQTDDAQKISMTWRGISYTPPGG